MKNNFKTIITAILISFYSFSIAQIQYKLVWQDEFNETTLNTNNWNYDIGNGCPNLCGWGNNELEYYREENVTINNSILSMTAKEESFSGYNYTSAKIHTRDKQTFTYGRFEARIKLPKGQGIWPAFWLLFNEPVYGTWPYSGEIDIMEMLGHDPDLVHGTIHYGGSTKGGEFDLPLEDFSDDFHEFALEWDTNRITWFVDSTQYATVTRWDLDIGYNWPFDHPFYIILNVAVGGNWPGNPNSSTEFPQTMEVDWVRVYQKQDVTPIVELAETKFNIFPNPINNKILNLSLEENEKTQFNIVNTLGQNVKTFDCISKNCSIDCSDLSEGLYYLIGKNEKSEKIISFVVRK